MYTNYERLHTLEAVKSSLTRYNGPLGIMAKDTPEGVDDDIWLALMNIDAMLDKRIGEVREMKLEQEAV